MLNATALCPKSEYKTKKIHTTKPYGMTKKAQVQVGSELKQQEANQAIDTKDSRRQDIVTYPINGDKKGQLQQEMNSEILHHQQKVSFAVTNSLLPRRDI